MPRPAIDSGSRGYTDKRGVADYFNVSPWQVDKWIRQGVLKRGVEMTPGGKQLFSFRDLDMAVAKAAASRKPRRKVRGIVRMRMEGTYKPKPRHKHKRDLDQAERREATDA